MGWFSGRESAESFTDLMNQLSAESDRGAVIVAAALVEDALESLIKARLVPSNSRDDELFDAPYAPMSTFSAKIDFAYRVGVIRPQVKSSLHILRKLRNDFAHTSAQLDFKSQKVQDRIRELFKLNKGVIDAMCQVTEDLENDEIKKMIEVGAGNGTSIEKMLALVNWRGLFNIFSAANCAALLSLPSQVESLPTLE